MAVDAARRPVRVAFFAADPQRPNEHCLGLAQEWRLIDDAVWKSDARTKLEIHASWGTRREDIGPWLDRTAPSIVHFAGHAASDGSLVLASEDGGPAYVAPEYLANVLGMYSETVRCVVLNACYTTEAAEAMASKLGCVIGTRTEVRDDAAARFSQSFYRSVAHGRDLRRAYELAAAEVPLIAETPNVHEIHTLGNADEVKLVE
jgi:CHAT domain-containing protein